ncbi:MAG: hypothetical protein HY652_05925 [Acidobacteria bacterium]|nr:hypothetical protein [Acidobacteriota bacterium]
MHQGKRDFWPSERGVALLVALIALALLSLLGLSLSFSGMTEVTISDNYESNVTASLLAEAGLNVARELLQGKAWPLQVTDPPGSFDQLLRGRLQTGPYDDTAYAFASNVFDRRNPLRRPEARFLNLSVPSLADSSDDGLLYDPATGLDLIPKLGVPLWIGNGLDGQPGTPDDVTYFQLPGPDGVLNSADDQYLPGVVRTPSDRVVGRSFVKITDNMEADGNLYDDTDGIVNIRAVGVTSASLAGTPRNSVAVVESLVSRGANLAFQSPFMVAGPGVNTTLDGNAFDIDGNDASGRRGLQPGVGFLFDSAPLDADAAALAWFNSMSQQQYDNITGRLPSSIPEVGSSTSIDDVTPETRDMATNPNNPQYNPDLNMLLDPNELAQLREALKKIAQNQGTYYSGTVNWGPGAHGDDFGDIHFIDGDFRWTGNGTGKGLIVVTGTVEIAGAVDFDGVVMAVGAGDYWMHGANKTLEGGVFIANMTQDTITEQWQYGPATVRLSGNSNVQYNSFNIETVFNTVIPLKQLGWRDVRLEQDQ